MVETTTTIDPRFLSLLGRGPKRIQHWEHWSCPDAETYITGIDYYAHPKQCREKMQELYPFLHLPVPPDDTPKPRPQLDLEGQSSSEDEEGHHRVRWGDGETGHWDWGKQFTSAEEVFAFSPLAQGDFTGWSVVESGDFRDEERLYEEYRRNIPDTWFATPHQYRWEAGAGFYNTMFMWPLLTFGWELFLETCMDERFERIMDEFAEINRRVFRCFARLPYSWVCCHDDIVTSRGPVCSPAWMHKYIYPRYEEFWSMLKASGKKVVFMADGCVDAVVDDVFACGADGIISEPYTDYQAIARKYENCFLAGEGDNRVLSRNDPAEIRAMVERMAETGRMSGGYMMCVGNHIAWNVPPPAVKCYLDCAEALAYR
jgi:hypothetical protein